MLDFTPWWDFSMLVGKINCGCVLFLHYSERALTFNFVCINFNPLKYRLIIRNLTLGMTNSLRNWLKGKDIKETWIQSTYKNLFVCDKCLLLWTLMVRKVTCYSLLNRYEWFLLSNLLQIFTWFISLFIFDISNQLNITFLPQERDKT